MRCWDVTEDEHLTSMNTGLSRKVDEDLNTVVYLCPRVSSDVGKASCSVRSSCWLLRVLKLRTLEFYLISILCLWWQLIIANPRKASIPPSRARGCYYLLSTYQQHHQTYRWLKTRLMMLPFRTLWGFLNNQETLPCIFRICCQGRSSESYPSNVGDDSLSNKSHF